MKKKKLIHTSEFYSWRKTLPKEKKALLSQYFEEIRAHLQLSKKESAAIIEDFENAIMHYTSNGISFEEAIYRLSPEKLGGFYARPPAVWFPLDDAAKIYPLSMRQGRMEIFRLSMYLKKKVSPELLQMALTFTIGRFPSFATTVKNGFFWHYLDARKLRYAVEEEKDIPCQPMTVSRSGSQSFRVLYFENRISVEFFHILTDGFGGMTFLKTLVAEYLRLLGVTDLEGEGVLKISDLPTPTETENAFLNAKKSDTSTSLADKDAIQLGGKLSKIRPCRIIHFNFDSEELRMKSKERGETVTGYLLRQMFVSAAASTDERTGEFSIQVPVNMRKYYPGDNMRNFSMYCGVRIPVEKITSGEDLTAEISKQLTEKTAKDCMSAKMFSAKTLVNALRWIPLMVKAPVARYIYSFFGESIFTTTLSNLGVVTLPKGMAENVTGMDFVLGPSSMNRACCALITCQGKAVMTVVKQTNDPSFEESLYRLFCKDGLAVVVEGSERYDG